MSFPLIRQRHSSRGLRPSRFFQILLVLSLSTITLFLVPVLVRFLVTAKSTKERAAGPPALARLSKQISIRANPRDPTISSRDGHDLLTAYVGPPELTTALEQNLAEPLSLTSADFDEDGVPDLLAGYSYNGRGIITLSRGNVDSIYPNSPQAKQRRAGGNFTDAPFLSPAQVFGAAIAPDFIGAGDFDADGHWDLVTGSRGGISLHFLRGDGTGRFGAETELALPGSVTAFTAGEINRRDGLTDIVIGLVGSGGPELRVFESPLGAINAQAETISAPAELTSVALGQLDDSYEVDLAATSGDHLLVLHGRDRKLTLPEADQEAVCPPAVSTRQFTSQVISVALGDFTGDSFTDISVLHDDGEIDMLAQPALTDSEWRTLKQQPAQTRAFTRSAESHQLARTDLPSSRVRSEVAQWPLDPVSQATASHARKLFTARVSTAPGDDLIAVGPTGNSLTVLAGKASNPDSSLADRPGLEEVASLSVTDATIAVLPMRLDVDALSDLVILRANSSAPAVTLSARGESAQSDIAPLAGGSFQNPAAITINAAGGNPAAASPYPSAITVAGFTDPLTRVRVRLNDLTKSFADSTNVLLVGPQGQKAMVLSNYFAHFSHVYLTFDDLAAAPIGAAACCVTSGNYKPTVNNPPSALPSPAPTGPYGSALSVFSGTNPNGTWSLYVSNGGPFGGTIGSGWGLVLNEPAAVTFVVTTTDDSGAGSLRQAILDANTNVGADIIAFNIPGSGVHTIIPTTALPEIFDPVTIDGTTQPGFAGKPIIEINGANAGSSTDGLVVSAGKTTIRGLVVNHFGDGGILLHTNGNNIIEGNFIGTNSSGTASLQNINGIDCGASGNLIGGTTPNARNVISGNLITAVQLDTQFGSTSGHTIQGNYIGTDFTGTLKLDNGNHGISSRSVPGSPNNTIGGTTAGARNVVSGNFFSNVDLVYGGSNGNLIQGNYLGTDLTGTQPITNTGDGVDLDAPNNTIGGTTPSARNIISGNYTSGVFINGSSTTGNLIQGNYIGPDVNGTARVNTNTGSGVYMIFSATSNTIGGTVSAARNIISGNVGPGIIVGAPLKDTTISNLIQGNYIGTDVSGELPLGNGTGISIPANATADRIIRNRIAYNECNGVELTDPPNPQDSPGLQIEITENEIFGNGCLGIDLGPLGITPNDNQDPDTGPNNLQNFPVLSSVVFPGGAGLAAGDGTSPAATISVNGTLNSTPNTTFTIHWYFSPDMQCTANQFATRPPAFGKIPDITTDGSGNAPFTIPFEFPAGLDKGVINCTAKDQAGNTSEFSACLKVSASPTPTPTPTPTPNPGCSTLTFTPNQAIPDNNPTGVNIPLVVNGLSGTVSDIDVKLVNVTHSWVGDLRFSLTSPDGARSSIFIDQPGVPATSAGCSVDDFINTVLDDEAGGGPIESVCANGMTGTFTPNNPLSVFDGSSPNGTWTLNVSDRAGGDTGSVQSVALIMCVNAGSSPTPTPTPTPTPSPGVRMEFASYNAAENISSKTVTVTRTGSTTGACSVNYTTSDTAGSSPCNSLNTGKASSRCDYETTLGTLKFASGEGSKTISIPIVDDAYNEGNESFTITLSSPVNVSLDAQSSATVTIVDDSTPATNPIGDAGFFTRMHYFDFLNRDADTPGLNFWSGQITSCGSDAGCTEVRRISVSASFFLSIEFKETGYLVERTYKAAYGDIEKDSTFPQPAHKIKVPIVRFNEFLADTQQITEGVVVLQTGWEQKLESNKVAFFNDFVQRTPFVTALPTTMTPTQFVDQLNTNAGNVLSANEKTTAVNLFGGGGNTSNTTARAQALRQVAEDADLNAAEFNRAFVLMQYYGYLRRNPDDPQDTDYTGYEFWLIKLNQFGGNYINAEMVKAFLSSIEYNRRFGQ